MAAIDDCEEYCSVVNLINELFTKTRDYMFMSRSEIYSIEKRIQRHLENMVKAVRGGEYGGTGIALNSSSGFVNDDPVKELEFALNLLKDLFELCHDLQVDEYCLRVAQAQIMWHLKNAVAIHDRVHEENYYQGYIKPSIVDCRF